MAHAQYVRSCGKVSPLSSLSPQSSQGATSTVDPTQARPYTGTGYMQIVPSLCVSERYDSNVFFAPPAPGVDSADFVTDVNPQVRVNHNGNYLTGYLDVGGFYETYVRNSDLDFFGTADTLHLNLDNSIKRLLPNASLFFTDYVRYTPIPPGYSTVAAGTSPGSPVNIQNVYAQGLLSYRANNLTNSATASTTYQITPLTSANASYSYMILRFGSSPIAGAQLFDTTTQTGTIGAKTKVSALDTITLSFSHIQSDFAPHSTGTTSSPSSSFVTNNAILGWSRTLTPYLTANVGGGGIVINPGITTWSANASLVLNTPNNTATINYVRSALPSFVGVGVPVISDVVSLSAIQKLALNWELDEYASYTHAFGGSGPTAIAYNSYFGGVDLYYWISKIWSTALSFDYMNFQQDFGSGTVSMNSNFHRYALTLSVKATWN